MRIETNRCDCNNRQPKQIDDKYNSMVCENCFEVISYEKPEKKSKNKKSKPKIKYGVVVVSEGGKHDQILMQIPK